MIPDDIGRKIDALVPPRHRHYYAYHPSCPMMGGPSWYVGGTTPVMHERMLDILDAWGVDAAAVRAEIAGVRGTAAGAGAA